MNKLWYAALLMAVLFTSCNNENKNIKNNAYVTDPLLYCKTVKELNNVVLQNNFAPIVASRNYLYATIAAYEVIAAGNPADYQSLAGQVRDLQAIPAPLAGKKIDFNFAAMLAFCKLGESVTFPEGSLQKFVDSMKLAVEANGMPEDVLANTIEYADTVGKVILAWSKKDNYLQTRTSSKYNITDTPGRWVPTPPMYSQALEPHWMEIRPLVMDSADQFVPPPPPAFNIKDTQSFYYKEVMLIKNAGDSLTDEQKHIAAFWDDLGNKLNVSGHLMSVTKKFSPPGHWMNIVGIAAEKSKVDFATTVYAYAKTSIAMFDAFIQCWDEKFRSNYARPETVINKYIDPNWVPYLQSPPFPEYTCGHSTVSASAAEVLTNIFGDNFAFTDSSELEFGIANRSFTSFHQAAAENNWARFYGGIHFHNSCLVSNVYGRKVGMLVDDRIKMKKNM